MKKTIIFFLGCFLAGPTFSQEKSEIFDQHRYGPLTHTKFINGHENKNQVKSFYKLKSDWQTIIDTTWGPGISLQDKLSIFDAYTNVVSREFAGFNPAGISLEEWNSMKASYRSKITSSTSSGAFSGLMSRLTYELADYHTYAGDLTVFYTPPNPGIPILIIGNWDVHHFGATLTLLHDSSLLVLRAIKNHPLDLQPGDVILGYEGIPWKNLVDTLLGSGIPIAHYQRNAKSARRYVELTSAGLNWHLFDTIDIVKYGSGDTVHLSVSPLLNIEIPNLWNIEQLPVPGVPIPDPSNITEPVYYGKVQGTNIGYICLYGEIDRTDGQFYEAVNSLKGTKGLIIDLRTNSGGWPLPRSGLNLLFNSFMYTLEDFQRCNSTDFSLCSSNDRDYWYVNGNPQSWYYWPLAVLTGPGCVSCGEYTAYALSYHPHVRFFGLSTCGAPGWGSDEWINMPGWGYSYTPRVAVRIDHPEILLSHQEFPVDDSVWFDIESAAKGEDPVVKKAIEWIQNALYTPDISNTPMTRIYPNPAAGMITIEISNTGGQGIEIELLNVSGQIVFRKDYMNSQDPFVKQIDLSGFEKGVYFLRARKAGAVYNGKIIVL
jgi:hypothetical protein